MKSRNVVTGTRDSEPSPAAIIGGILALGVVREISRAARERDQALPVAPPEVPLYHPRRNRLAPTNRNLGDDRCCSSD